ncbi:unnamed protein product [Sphagnum jensenii]
MLANLVRERLPQADHSIHICYGVGHSGQHTLNANCSRYTKLEQARLLQEGLGPGALRVYDNADLAREGVTHTPLFARTLVHSRGRDIKVALEPWQIEPLMIAGSSFFTAHEPSVREFRTWTYRNRHLGTYEKVLRRPEDCKRLGRNFSNGFDFSGMVGDETPQAIKDLSRDALRVLGLDFGAVDILQRPDGSYCVLEVNSAPGVSNDRRRVIQALAHRIVRWVENGCPQRSEDWSNARRLDGISPSLSWRKRLLAIWALAKNARIPELTGWSLREFRVRKGAGWRDAKTSFKRYATSYRKFKVASLKKKISNRGSLEQPVNRAEVPLRLPTWHNLPPLSSGPPPYLEDYPAPPSSPEDYPAPPSPPTELLQPRINRTTRQQPSNAISGRISVSNPHLSSSWVEDRFVGGTYAPPSFVPSTSVQLDEDTP